MECTREELFQFYSQVRRNKNRLSVCVCVCACMCVCVCVCACMRACYLHGGHRSRECRWVQYGGVLNRNVERLR